MILEEEEVSSETEMVPSACKEPTTFFPSAYRNPENVKSLSAKEDGIV